MPGPSVSFFTGHAPITIADQLLLWVPPWERRDTLVRPWASAPSVIGSRYSGRVWCGVCKVVYAFGVGSDDAAWKDGMQKFWRRHAECRLAPSPAPQLGLF